MRRGYYPEVFRKMVAYFPEDFQEIVAYFPEEGRGWREDEGGFSMGLGVTIEKERIAPRGGKAEGPTDFWGPFARAAR